MIGPAGPAILMDGYTTQIHTEPMRVLARAQEFSITCWIKVDAYPKLNLEGHVDSIQLGSGSKFTAFPPENATGNFVKIVQRVPVKIVIDKGLDPSIPLPLGISVDPAVTVR